MHTQIVVRFLILFLFMSSALHANDASTDQVVLEKPTKKTRDVMSDVPSDTDLINDTHQVFASNSVESPVVSQHQFRLSSRSAYHQFWRTFGYGMFGFLGGNVISVLGVAVIIGDGSSFFDGAEPGGRLAAGSILVLGGTVASGILPYIFSITSSLDGHEGIRLKDPAAWRSYKQSIWMSSSFTFFGGLSLLIGGVGLVAADLSESGYIGGIYLISAGAAIMTIGTPLVTALVARSKLKSIGYE